MKAFHAYFAAVREGLADEKARISMMQWE